MAWVNSLWDLVPHPLTLGSLSLEGQLGWAPGSLRDDSWAGSGNLVLRKPPTEICLLSARIRNLEGESCVLDLALSCHLVLVAQLYLTLCDPMGYRLPGSSVHGIFQARILECHFLLQRIFPTQELNLGLLHYRRILCHLSHQRSRFLS